MRRREGRLVLVLTALPEEHRAVSSRLTGAEAVKHRSGTWFTVGELAGAGVRVVLAMAQPGDVPAALIAERAISEFDPDALFFVGTAISLSAKVGPGDVVVATKVYAPQAGVQGRTSMLAWPQVFSATYALLEHARFYAMTSDAGDGLEPGEPFGYKVHFEPIAAAEAMPDSSDTPLGDALYEHFNDAVALERGSVGAAQAAHYNHGLPALIVRGISHRIALDEAVDAEESTSAQAADYAAHFALGFVEAWARHAAPESEPESGPEPARPDAAGWGSADPVHLNPLHELGSLARAATVAIGGPPGAAARTVWGAGVLVAPGWVASSARVFEAVGWLGTGDGEEIGVEVDGRVVRARVAYLRSRREAQAADLALVRLLEPTPGARPAWLGERHPILCESAQLYGRRPAGDTAASPGAPSEAVFSRCRMDGQDGRVAVIADLPESVHGLLGGPLLDGDRGEVVGVVGSREGGVPDCVVPLTALLELRPEHHLHGTSKLGDEPWRELLRLHDLWHLEQQDRPEQSAATWVDARCALPRRAHSTWGPTDRLEELGWLARITAPSGPEQVEHAMPVQSGRLWADHRPRLRTWRDGFGQLGDDQVEHLNFLIGVLRELQVAERRELGTVQPATAAMQQWVQQRRRELSLADRGATPPLAQLPESVLVKIEPLIRYGPPQSAERYRWSISTGFGAGRWQLVTAGEDGAKLTIDDALGEVRDVLASYLSGADGSSTPARLEIAVPVERVLPPAHKWRTPRSVQGAEREVVVRHGTRDAADDPKWSEQWNRLHGAKRLRARPVASVRDLDSVGECDVPVVCRHGGLSGATVAQALLERGHAVAVMRRAPDGPAPCETPTDVCTGFCGRVQGWVGTRTARDLPRDLKELRALAHGEQGAGHEWTADLVLLFDDPHNPLP